MKYRIMFMGMLLGAAMQSCSDEGPAKGTPLEAGTEIEFGVSMPAGTNSRTYYGPEADHVWPIYWNYGATKDEVFIFSEQAMPGRNQATYRVMATEQDCKSAVSVEKTGAAGIQAGTNPDADYQFYALYPASAVKAGTNGAVTGTTISGTLSGSQRVTLDASTANTSAKKMLPDMNNCLMIGSSGAVKLTQGSKVGLQFKPFVTALDITVNGPNTSTEVQIASVVISTTSTGGTLTGDFTYDYGNGSFNAVATSGTNSLNISTRDANGNPITLKNGESLNLQAFILPDADVKDLKVRVVSAGAQYWDRTLDMTGAAVESCNVLKVNLARINMGDINFDYSIWLSQMNTSTYINDISLPGSALSWNTNANGVSSSVNQTQSTTIKQQFDAGIRVFQAHAWYNMTDPSHLDGQTPSLHLIAAYKGGQTDTGVQLYDAVKILTDEMALSHADEFCVLMLSDYNNNSGSMTTFYETVRRLTDKLAADGLLAVNVTPETTIAEVKGKVILKLQLNQSGTDAWAKLNGSKSLFNTFEAGSLNTLNTRIDTEGATNSVWYSPLTFGTTPSTSDTGGIGTTNANKIATWPMSFIFTEQANPCTSTSGVNNIFKTACTNNINAYKQYYSSSRHNVFGMTYLGGTGYDGMFSDVQPLNVTTTYIDLWNTATASGFDDKPYGWVMFNQVGSGNSTINAAVAKVIEHNKGTSTWKPATRPITQNSPSGDADAPGAGPSVF